MATSSIKIFRTGNILVDLLDILNVYMVIKVSCNYFQDALQAQIVIKELSEITENKSTHGDDADNEELLDPQSKEYIENKTVEVI